jgi:hypothetical protein
MDGSISRGSVSPITTANLTVRLYLGLTQCTRSRRLRQADATRDNNYYHQLDHPLMNDVGLGILVLKRYRRGL